MQQIIYLLILSFLFSLSCPVSTSGTVSEFGSNRTGLVNMTWIIQRVRCNQQGDLEDGDDKVWCISPASNRLKDTPDVL